MKEVFVLLGLLISLSVAQNLREQFHDSFQKKCLKYPFVDKYFRMLENPPDKYLVFSYQDPNMMGGGFGDRMGGLLTAFVQALRFNRTLIIQSKNGFNELFRPYHPTDALKRFNESQYTWKNSVKWSKFQEWKKRNANYTTQKERYEYDLTSCVSYTEEGFTPEKITECAIDKSEDVETIQQYPILKLASNRAYLCRWLSHPKKLRTAHREVLSGLGMSLRDLKEGDLFEVAGCAYRLMMWPTELLWAKVDEAYAQMLREAADRQVATPLTASPKDTQEASEGKKSKKSKEKKQKKKKAKKTALPPLPPLSTAALQPSVTLSTYPIYQIGVHLRCGDVWSYRGLSLHTPQVDEHACVHDPDHEDEHERSRYLVAGNPVGLGECVKSILTEYQVASQALLPAPRAGELVVGVEGEGEAVLPALSSVYKAREIAEWVYTRNMTLLVYMTSDNVHAEEQMLRTVAYPGTLISPQGCHIEYDTSKECYQLTTVYWFILSLSRTYVTQTFSDYNMPTSAFSRYAGLYSLSAYPSPFRSGRYCDDEVFPTSTIAWRDQGNWVCKI